MVMYLYLYLKYFRRVSYPALGTEHFHCCKTLAVTFKMHNYQNIWFYPSDNCVDQSLTQSLRNMLRHMAQCWVQSQIIMAGWYSGTIHYCSTL